MGVLKLGLASFLLAGVGCYSPELRDCTVSCSTNADCASDLVCGGDHLCAAPEIAGRCAMQTDGGGSGRHDAGVDPRPDGKPDAAPPDAATHVTLDIKIDGEGRLSLVGIGTCDKAPPQKGECTFVVPIGQLVTSTATAYPDSRFDKWTTAACASVPINTCSFTATTDTPLGVKFKKDD